MIITCIGDHQQIFTAGSYKSDLECFNETVRLWKYLSDRYNKTYFERGHNAAALRYKEDDGNEVTHVIVIIQDIDILNKKWEYVNKDVQNLQPPHNTTHIEGWFLQ